MASGEHNKIAETDTIPITVNLTVNGEPKRYVLSGSPTISPTDGNSLIGASPYPYSDPTLHRFSIAHKLLPSLVPIIPLSVQYEFRLGNDPIDRLSSLTDADWQNHAVANITGYKDREGNFYLSDSLRMMYDAASALPKIFDREQAQEFCNNLTDYALERSVFPLIGNVIYDSPIFSIHLIETYDSFCNRTHPDGLPKLFNGYDGSENVIWNSQPLTTPYTKQLLELSNRSSDLEITTDKRTTYQFQLASELENLGEFLGRKISSTNELTQEELRKIRSRDTYQQVGELYMKLKRRYSEMLYLKPAKWRRMSTDDTTFVNLQDYVHRYLNTNSDDHIGALKEGMKAYIRHKGAEGGLDNIWLEELLAECDKL